MGIGDDIYDGAAAFGRFMSYVGLVIGGLIALVFLILGIVFLVKRDPYSKTVKATVTDAKCLTLKCTLDLKYMVNGKEYTSSLTEDSKPNVQKGELLEIRYKPEDPASVSLRRRGTKTIGVILIVVALIIATIVGVYFWAVQRYKFAAAATGVGTAWDIIS